MTRQTRQSPAATGLSQNSCERQDTITDTSNREVRLIADILEQSECQSNQQRQAMMRLHQVISDAHQAGALAFLKPSDETAVLALLGTFDALAAVSIFEDDATLYRSALEAARAVARLIVTGQIAVVAIYGQG